MVSCFIFFSLEICYKHICYLHAIGSYLFIYFVSVKYYSERKIFYPAVVYKSVVAQLYTLADQHTYICLF